MSATTRARRLRGAVACLAVSAAVAVAGPAAGTAATAAPSGTTAEPAATTAATARTGVAPAAAPPGRALTGPTAGCGAPSPQAPGTSADRALTSGGIERSVRVHLPAGYTADRPWPVVLVFHGRGNSGPTTEGFSGLSELPAIVAYPDGVPGGEGKRSWQGASYSAPGVDDVAFTGDLIDHLEDTLCVDARRVHATGKSNGGGFTEILACRMPDRIAAIAPVAGAYYRAGEPPCEPGRPVPALFVHGTADATIPYTGDADRGLPAVPDKVAEWADRNGCHAEPATRRIEPDVTVQRFEGCARGGQAGHVAVDGGGHTWPGATAYSGGGHTTQTVHASELIGAFFGLVRS